MSFGEWRGHADVDDFGRRVRLNIARETSPGRWQVFVGASEHGSVFRDWVDEGDGVSVGVVSPLVEMDVAKTIYQALDRLFGHQNQDGKVEALEESLKKERDRVDFFIARAFAPRTVVEPQKHDIG